jgi:hypothetical protein
VLKIRRRNPLAASPSRAQAYSMTDLPPTEYIADLTASAAAVMSMVSRSQPSQSALASWRAIDERLGHGVFDKPATFVVEIAGRYLQAAGDFVCGMQYVTSRNANLTFSSASLARSACEFANRASWLADSNASDEQRIARAIGVMDNTLKEEKALLLPDVLADLEQMARDVQTWRTTVGFAAKASLPTATALYEHVDPQNGRATYKRLSNAAHGSFFTLLAGHHAAVDGSPYGLSEAWWRALIATCYGITAAERLIVLYANEPPQELLQFWEFWNQCRQVASDWEEANDGED